MQLLYLLISRDGTQVKIGITKTTATLKTRLASLGGANLFDIESSRFFECERARTIEQFLHFHFRHLNIVPSNAFVINGTTECFSVEAMDLALQFIEYFRAGRPIVFSEKLVLPTEPPCHSVSQTPNCRTRVVSLQPTAHVEQFRLNQKQAAQAHNFQINEQAYLLFSHIIKNWNDNSELAGLYRRGSELRIVLRKPNSFGSEWLPFASINFAALRLFTNSRPSHFDVFSTCFHNQSAGFLKLSQELTAIHNKHDIPHEWYLSPLYQQFTQILTSIPSVDETFNPRLLDDELKNFSCEVADAWFGIR